jgi:2-isopropylmalate synthase
VGVPSSKVVLTARTGRHGVRHRLEALGHHLSADELEQVYQRFLVVADKKREVFDEDLAAIVHDEIRPVKVTFELDYLHTASGTGTIPTATVRLKVAGETREGAACGDGPVDATYKALTRLAGVEAKLVSYDIRAVTGGTEAMGEVTVRLERAGALVFGRGASTDIIEASARAYVDGLNKLAAARPSEAGLPEAEV